MTNLVYVNVAVPATGAMVEKGMLTPQELGCLIINEGDIVIAIAADMTPFCGTTDNGGVVYTKAGAGYEDIKENLMICVSNCVPAAAVKQIN